MKIDFNEIGDIQDLRSIPAGVYPCYVAEVRESQSPSGHTRWGLRWEVGAGDYLGRTACWDSLHWSERGLPRVKFVLTVLGFPSDGRLEVRPEELQGRRALVTVESEEREDPSTCIRRISNRVPFAGYSLLKEAEESVPTAKPA